jgi:hypothetical protein
MSSDELKRAWQAQASHSRITVDGELLLREVRRNQRSLAAAIFWRDVREVGVSFLLAPLWVYLGVTCSLPWAWYLTVPALLWIGGLMLVDRARHGRRHPEPGESLCRHVEGSLAQVEHQIWLLRNVHWWYLLPLAFSVLAFFTQVAWGARSGGWWAAIAFTGMVAVAAAALGGVYCLNQHAVRADLEPRRQELAAILAHLNAGDEAAVEGGGPPNGGAA